MIHTRQFTIPVYGSKTTVIIFDGNWKNVIKKLDKLKFTTTDIKDWEFVYGLQLSETINRKRCFCTILKQSKDMESFFVHELWHLTQDILEWKDVTYIRGGKNEPYAYLHESIYKKMIPFIREHALAPRTYAKKKRKQKK